VTNSPPVLHVRLQGDFYINYKTVFSACKRVHMYVCGPHISVSTLTVLHLLGWNCVCDLAGTSMF